jgi:Inhibitor of growth proteins N-terminal histone-binding
MRALMDPLPKQAGVHTPCGSISRLLAKTSITHLRIQYQLNKTLIDYRQQSNGRQEKCSDIGFGRSYLIASVLIDSWLGASSLPVQRCSATHSRLTTRTSLFSLKSALRCLSDSIILMSASLGRRQSGRAIRSTASKQNYYGRGPPPEAPLPTDTEPGFFPAITHFTDAVDALPREVMRHFTMLKEMEAKLHGPDETLVELAKRIGRLPGRKLNEDDAQPANGVSEVYGADVPDPVAPGRSEGERGTLLRQLRDCVALMAPMLDEKIAVLSTANITLERQLECMKSSYDRVPDEVSVEARLGSTTHWAYVVEKEPKKTGNERSRRDAANAYSVSGGALNDVDMAAARSEARREAMLARKIRNQHLDSDFDERPASRKQSSKSRKQAEAQSADARGFGHDLQNGSGGRKQKKTAAGAQAMEKSMSNTGSRHKGQAGSPTPVAENSKKRKAGSLLPPGRKR